MDSVIQEDEILNSFIKKVKGRFANSVQKIILFGSIARRDFTEQSDYDMLLIFDKIKGEEKAFIEDLASGILIEHGRLFSTFIISQHQFEEMKFEPFIINAKREGVVL